MLISRIVFLYNFLLFLFTNKYIKLKDMKKLQRVGNGVSNTFILKDKYVIKIKNQIREKVNIKLYNGSYNDKFFYDVKDKFKKEFEVLKLLSKNNLSPKPIEWSKNYLIIEYINSITLSEYLIKTNDYKIFIDVLQSIDKIHSLGIFHGDLNLDNILITPDKNIKFIDFESSFRDDLSLKEKKNLEFEIFHKKMERFYPKIYKVYNEKFR